MFVKRRYVICRLAVAGMRRAGTVAKRSTLTERLLASLPLGSKGAVGRRGSSPALIVERIRNGGPGTRIAGRRLIQAATAATVSVSRPPRAVSRTIASKRRNGGWSSAERLATNPERQV